MIKQLNVILFLFQSNHDDREPDINRTPYRLWSNCFFRWQKRGRPNPYAAIITAHPSLSGSCGACLPVTWFQLPSQRDRTTEVCKYGRAAYMQQTNYR